MSEPGKYEPIKRQQPATFEPVDPQAPAPAPDEPATFEPVDKLEALKAEMAAKFKGMGENLEKIDEVQGPQPDAKQPPIANAKSRFKDMLREFGEGIADIRPFIPKSNTLFHSVAGVLGQFAEREQKKEREGERREDRESLARSRDARTARDEAYTAFLNTWKVPPDLAMKAAAMSQGGPQTGVPMAYPVGQGQQAGSGGGMADTGGVPASVAQAAQTAMPAASQGIQPPDGGDPGGAAGAVSAPFAPPPVPPSLAASASSAVSGFSTASRPGPASAISTPSYAAALAGGGNGGGNSGGSELRDILSVLREILDAVKQLKLEGGNEETDDESETVENRRPFFRRERDESKPQSVIKEALLKSESPFSVTRPPQQSAQESMSTLGSLVNAAESLLGL